MKWKSCKVIEKQLLPSPPLLSLSLSLSLSHTHTHTHTHSGGARAPPATCMHSRTHTFTLALAHKHTFPTVYVRTGRVSSLLGHINGRKLLVISRRRVTPRHWCPLQCRKRSEELGDSAWRHSLKHCLQYGGQRAVTGCVIRSWNITWQRWCWYGLMDNALASDGSLLQTEVGFAK